MSNNESPKLDNREAEKRTRDLFGVQLEVTSLMLEAERRKLAVLQRELIGSYTNEGGSLKAKELQQQELILVISRIQQQYDQLEWEYRQAAVGALRKNNIQNGRKTKTYTAPSMKTRSVTSITYSTKFTVVQNSSESPLINGRTGSHSSRCNGSQSLRGSHHHQNEDHVTDQASRSQPAIGLKQASKYRPQ